MIRAMLAALLALWILPAAAQPVQHPHAAWTRNASIYEVNVRQFSDGGGFKARHPAMANGSVNTSFKMIDAGDDAIFAFERGQQRRSVLVVANLLDEPSTSTLAALGANRTLGPWEYRIKVR